MGREDEIRQIAYHMWELEDRPEGKELEFWLMAENIWEINHRTGRHPSVVNPPPPEPDIRCDEHSGS